MSTEHADRHQQRSLLMANEPIPPLQDSLEKTGEKCSSTVLCVFSCSVWHCRSRGYHPPNKAIPESAPTLTRKPPRRVVFSHRRWGFAPWESPTGNLSVLLRCPAEISPDKAGSFLADRCHSLTSLLPPPAALGSLPFRFLYGKKRE